jgi:DNA polymerase III subunit gamma/tau
VRGMLGLADRTRVIDLFEALMRADVARALVELRDQYDTGADPAMVLGDLAEFTHFVTRLKIVPASADDASLTETERMRGRAFAAKLSMRVLARTWQMLLKGIAEVEAAGRPLAAAEMVLVRIAYAADLPTPDEIVRSLGDAASGNGNRNAAATTASYPVARAGEGAERASARSEMPSRSRAGSRGGTSTALASAAPTAALDVPRGDAETPTRVPASFEELVALVAEKRDVSLKSALERDVRLVGFEVGRLEVALEQSAPKTLIGDLSRKLGEWTGRRWMVVVSAKPGMPSLRAQAAARDAELKDGVRADPLVQAVLARYPGAEIVGVRPPPQANATDLEGMALNIAVDGEFPDGEVSEDELPGEER